MIEYLIQTIKPRTLTVNGQEAISLVLNQPAPFSFEVNGLIRERVIYAGEGDPAINIPFVNQTSITYNHNLGRKIAVYVYDNLGKPLIADIDTFNSNQVKIEFLIPKSGSFLIL